MKHYDAVVIGSGQGGTPLAKKLARQNLKTAIIERRFIGGTCINDGCTPTKTMVASARMMHLIGRSEAFGVTTNGASLNFKKIIERKNKMVEDFRKGGEDGLRKTQNLDIFFGQAVFMKDKELKVFLNDEADEDITADRIFINAGCRPAVPKIEGLDSVPYLDSTSIMELDELPKHLVVIGAGYVALEFGQMFRRFGSKVTILDHSARFLSKEDEDVSVEIKNFLEQEGTEIFTNCSVKKVSSHNKNISVHANINNKEKVFTGSHLLIAIGRTPNTDTLQLSNTNIQREEHGHIIVNEKLETNVDGIYALGDIKGGPEFTHISYNDHLIIYNNLFENGHETITNRLVPYCMFTDPQLGRVGLNEQEAVKKNLNFMVAKLPMKYVARALETGETTGFMKAIIDADSKKILGAAIIGAQGGELMSMLELAMMGGLTYDVLRNAIFAHPLYAESLNNLFIQLDKSK
jgi:pyruvate/2-oxoglutarate dehydrogenase complex dihydrolipoamide dehydrogenase (E3) component